ncbi:MAG: hypothetical protein Q8T08_02385, partial [Ignavibacteria bacterium]|nr:hypothetical protein [Ignavibacteria bacterium]
YSVNSVVEKTIENQDFTTLRVQLINRPIGKTEIKINNDSTYILGDLFGDISLPYIGVRTISIEKIFDWTDIGLEKYDFYTIDSSSNDITIIVKPYNIYHLMDYFVDYEIKIKNKKLFDWHKPNGKFDRKCYLKKTNIANKEF